MSGQTRASRRAPIAVDDGDTLANVLRRHIAAQILDGVLSPGTRLDERSLALEHGVSRTPVREAIQQLVWTGLANSRPHAGAIVQEIDPSRIASLCEASILLETLCIRLAATRATAIDIGRLRLIHDACARAHSADDASGYALQNRKFHSAIIEATRNPDLCDAVESCRLRIAPFQRVPFRDARRRQASQQEHGAIIDALERADADQAAQAMTHHLSNAAVAIDECLGGVDRGGPPRPSS